MRRRLLRLVWDLQRFGLTPSKLSARLSNQNEPRVLLISVPKAGTHLLERALCLHPRLYRRLVPTLHSENLGQYGGLDRLLVTSKPGQLLVSHLHHSPERMRLAEAHGIHCIFIIRDPRDIVLSRANYVARSKRHPYHFLFAGKNLGERVRLAILGDSRTGYMGIRQRLQDFSGWMDTSIHVVRFEQLVSAENRLHVLRNLYDFLGMPVGQDLLSSIGGTLVSSASPTFRKGSVGEWQRIFDEEINSLFEQAVGQALMARYGYGE